MILLHGYHPKGHNVEFIAGPDGWEASKEIQTIKNIHTHLMYLAFIITGSTHTQEHGYDCIIVVVKDAKAVKQKKLNDCYTDDELNH